MAVRAPGDSLNTWGFPFFLSLLCVFTATVIVDSAEAQRGDDLSSDY